LVNFGQVLQILTKINWIFIIASILLGLATSLISSFRLKILFKIIKKDISLIFLWSRSYIAGLSTTILPFFSGGFVFSYLVAGKIKEKYLKTFSIVLTDFCLSTGMLFIFGFAGSLKWGIEKPFIFLAFLIIVVAFAGIFLRDKIGPVTRLLTKNKIILSESLFLSLAIFLLGIAQSYLIFMAFNLKLNFVTFGLAISLFGILNLIPGAPTKIGQYEALGVLSFGYILNIDKTLLSAVFLTQHIISLTLSVSVGLLSMWATGLNTNDLTKKKPN